MLANGGLTNPFDSYITKDSEHGLEKSYCTHRLELKYVVLNLADRSVVHNEIYTN